MTQNERLFKLLGVMDCIASDLYKHINNKNNMQGYVRDSIYDLRVDILKEKKFAQEQEVLYRKAIDAFKEEENKDDSE